VHYVVNWSKQNVLKFDVLFLQNTSTHVCILSPAILMMSNFDIGMLSNLMASAVASSKHFSHTLYHYNNIVYNMCANPYIYGLLLVLLGWLAALIRCVFC